MSKQTQIDELLSGWKRLHHSRKMRICEVIHECTADHYDIALQDIKASGHESLRKELTDILNGFTTDELQTIYDKYLEVKV